MASLAEAELKALTLNAVLRNGTFEWPTWQPDDKEGAKTQITRSVFEETARRLHGEKYANAPERGAEAWRKRLATALNKLPTQGELTLHRLVAVIEKLPPATSARRETGLVWGMVARKLGMDPKPLREAGTGGNSSHHEPSQATKKSKRRSVDCCSTAHTRRGCWGWSRLTDADHQSWAMQS